MKLPGRITIDSACCGGRPHFKGTRTPVYVVLEMLANEESWEDIHDSYPQLTRDDLRDALEYAKMIAAVPHQSPIATAV